VAGLVIVGEESTWMVPTHYIPSYAEGDYLSVYGKYPNYRYMLTDYDPTVDKEKEYTPPPVTGYRKLTQTEVDLMNKIKAKGDELGELVAELNSMDNLDQRWVAIGKTDLQTGIMALVRAVAQPQNF